MPEDIILDHEIPHIIIKPRHKHELKPPYRKRMIPLVGFALDAFKACPQGFIQYYGKPDILSNTIGKYLRDNDLYETQNHAVYSLWNSFQDCLLAANEPDRIQTDLMGHKFERPDYGNGSALKQKQGWLQKIALKNSHIVQ